MKVEIWSDIACPWCYIGRRRFEKALGQFEHGDQVEVIWRSFELDPYAPKEYPGTVTDMLVEKKGIDRRRAEAMNQHVTDLAAQEGLEYHLETARVGNSFDAHRLIHLAAYYNLQDAMKERIQKAYFTESQSFSDHDTLVRLAVEVGLDADEVRSTLETNAYAEAVRNDERRAAMIGVTGVPFFLFDERYAVSGAQPTELFLTAFNRAWADSHPIVELVSGDADAGACDDGACVV
jgi:predicted DsbA family dithiol-disulfide isomerase